MKRFTLALIPVFLFLFVQAQNPQLHQGISFIFNDNNPVPSGDHLFEASTFIDFKPNSNYLPSPNVSLTARINPYLIFPPIDDETGGPNPGDDGVVGTLSGSLSVNQLGSACYTVPLDLPSGVVGMKPNLFLNYNSLMGNGVMGIGWSVGGLSSISRLGTDLYHDGFVDGVNFNQNDQFSLDGNRLIGINNLNYGSDGAEYRTEIQSFQKVISYGVAGNGPQWFKVWTKDGKIIEYGNSEDSRIEAPGRADVLTWLVTRISDLQGNFVKFEYYENGDMTCCPYKIKYTGNSNANPHIDPFYEVEFQYESRPDPYFAFIAGAPLNTKLRLSNIVIKYLPTSSIYKTYDFQYSNEENSQITGITDYYSRLIKITVSSGNEHINPTTITWGDKNQNQNLFPIFDATSSNNNANIDYYHGDFNGDGKTDVIKVFWNLVENVKHMIRFELHLANNTGTGFTHFPEADWSLPDRGIQCFAVGDFNGDGLSDLIVGYDSPYEDPPDHDHLWVHLAKVENDEFHGFCLAQMITSYTLDVDHRILEIQTGDFNNDSRDDLAIKICHKSETNLLADVYSCDIQFSNLTSLNTVDFVRKSWLGYLNRFYIGNFVSSQKKDLLVFKGEICQFHYWDDVNQQLTRLPQDFGYPSKYHYIFPGDFNGDGLTDLLTCSPSPNYYWELSFSTGTGGTFPTIPITFLPNVNPDLHFLYANHKFFVADYNGDGKTDIMKASKPDNSLNFYFSKGNGTFFETPEVCNISFAYISSNAIRLNDFNGDGKSDLFYLAGLGLVKIILSHPDEKRELAHCFTDGLGTKVSLSYLPLSGYSSSPIYTRKLASFQESQGEIRDFQGPLFVVKRISSDNGLGGTLSTYYAYKGATIHLTRMGFLGFEKISADNISTGIKKTDTYSSTVEDYSTSSRKFFFPHVVKSQHYFGSHLYCESENIIKGYQFYGNANPPKDKIFYPYSLLSNTEEWEMTNNTYLKTSRIKNDYNTADIIYGNPTKTTTLNDANQLDISTSDDQFTFKEDVSNTHHPYEETIWDIAKINTSTEQTFIKEHGSQTRIRQFDYYPSSDERSRLLWKDIIEPGTDPLSHVTEYDYFSNGNVKSKRLSAPNANPPIQSRLTTYEYSDTYQSRFLTKIIDPLTHFTWSRYNPLTGNLLWATDINNLTTTYSSNIFATDKQSQEPGGKQYRKVLRWVASQPEAPTNALFYSWEQSSGESEVCTYYDKLGRTLRKVTKGFDNRSVFVDQQYDELGRPARTSDPYYSGDTPAYTENEYNTTLPRVDFVILPDQTQLSYSYNGLTTATTNEAGQTKTLKKNAIGLVDESTDATSHTVKYEYSYDGNCFINTIVIFGHPETQTTIQIDKYGNRKQIIDPSSGTINETYNAFKELISRQDQKQNEQNKTRYTYDLLGRMISRTEGGQTTTWVYDTKPFGKGQLDHVSNSDHTVEYFYDELCRLKQKDEVIAGEEDVFSYKFKYDALNRLMEQTYPSGIMIRNHYTSNGYLNKITQVDHNVKLLWETFLLNAKDQLAQAIIGKCITTEFTYQQGTDYLESIRSTTDDNVIQDLEYQWDNVGNLAGRKKWINRSQFQYLDETFVYDQLNRLKTVSLNHQVIGSFLFDDIGNITEKTPFTNMSYGGQGVGPYAITSANFIGNEMPLNTQDIAYTVFDKISSISEGTNSLSMLYGVDHERIKQIIRKNDDINSKKLYIGGLCEKITDAEGTRAINFINGPGGLFAFIVKNRNGRDDIHYILKDHLGSIHCITDESGNLLEELSFDSWGKRRNPTDWTYNNIPTTHIFDRGYTGHEQLDLFGLINMNGRAYDPLVGRFLSTDAFVQAPDFTQSFNRYTYCLNNPLTYNDPDGEFWHLLIGAALGGTLNLIANWNNIHNVGDGVGYFCVGAIAGAVSSGVGAGISSAMAVGSTAGGAGTFAAGFLGTSTALPAASSFATGAVVGAGTGFASGFLTGTGNALMQGQNFGDALGSGMKTGIIGGASGALLGGVMGGIDAVGDERNFWSGDDIGTGRSPFAFNNTNKPFNAYRTSKGGYEFRNNIDRYINNPVGPYSKRVTLGNHTDEYGFSTGNVSRMNNYLMPGEDPLNLSLDKFVGQGNISYSGTIPNGCTIQIRFDGNVVRVLGSGDVIISSMVIPANVQNLGVQYIGTPLSGQTISPFRSIITGYVKWP